MKTFEFEKSENSIHIRIGKIQISLSEYLPLKKDDFFYFCFLPCLCMMTKPLTFVFTWLFFEIDIRKAEFNGEYWNF
jgi:hypothetical protein